jgi:hypothetical protein
MKNSLLTTNELAWFAKVREIPWGKVARVQWRKTRTFERGHWQPGKAASLCGDSCATCADMCTSHGYACSTHVL